MDPRRIALLAAALILSLGGLLALLALEWRHDLGRFAENPHHFELEAGRKAVAGGRAVVTLDAVSSEGVELSIRCRDVEVPLRLAIGAASEEVCGLRLALVAVEPAAGGARALLRASW